MWLEEKLGKTRHWVFLGRTAIVIDFCLFFKYFFKRPPEKKPLFKKTGGTGIFHEIIDGVEKTTVVSLFSRFFYLPLVFPFVLRSLSAVSVHRQEN